MQQAAWNLENKNAANRKAVADAQAAENNAAFLGTSAAEAAWNLKLSQAEGIKTKTSPGPVGQALMGAEMTHKLLNNIRSEADSAALNLKQQLRK